MHLSEKARDWLMVLPLAAVLFALWPFIGHGKAFAAAGSVGVFYVIISRMWDRRREKTFWGWLGLFTLIHIAALWIIHFPDEIRPSLISLPFLMVDGLLMYMILTWVDDNSKTRRGSK